MSPDRTIRLDGYAAQGYPDLRRAMIVTVHRPWLPGRISSWLPGRLFWFWLTWRIRVYETRLARLSDPAAPPASESHAMLYAGGGWCWSQDSIWRLTRLAAYRGCRLTFWDPGWPAEIRDRLMAECAPHKGGRYGWRDILALAMTALTGRRAWLAALGDGHRWICSEAVCALARSQADPGFGGEGDCLKTPQELYDWMRGRAWPALELWIE